MTRQAIKFKITDAGRDAIVDPPGGIRAVFSHVAIGRGNVTTPPEDGGYQPVGNETALKNEFMRVALGAGVKPAADQISFAGNLDGNATGWINEVGLFLNTGVLWALWSEDPAVIQRYEDDEPVYGATLGFKTLGVPFLIQSLVTVADIDLDALDVVVNGPPINLTVNLYDAQISNLLAIVTDRARALRDLEAARRLDEARIASLVRRVAQLEERINS